MTSRIGPSIAFDAETLLAHRAWLAKVARVLVARSDEIDDVLQQTFTQALANPPRHATNVRAWLGTIARNVVRSDVRSRKAREARELAVEPAPPIENPHDAVERAELQRRVVNAVLALDEPYRSTLILRFFEEQDVSTIAQRTSTGEDTVRTRLRRGIERVRHALERMAEEESRGAADRGAGARALLLVQLRDLAGSGGAAAGEPGTPSSRVGTRTSSHAGPRVLPRNILLGTSVVVVLAGGWLWVRQTSAPATSMRSKEVAVADPAPEVSPRAAPAAESAQRSKDSTPAVPVLPEPTSRPIAATATIRGVVNGPDDKPIVGAQVWAIRCANQVPKYDLSRFVQVVADQVRIESSGRTLSKWIRTSSDEAGKFEIAGLPATSAWQVAAFDRRVGAVVTELQTFDRKRLAAVVDLRLVPGAFLRGTVRDRDGGPIGNATLILYCTLPGEPSREVIVPEATGSNVGRYDIGFRCGDPIEIECRAPGFMTAKRAKVELDRLVDNTVTNFALERRPGAIVRGKIVDPSGSPIDLQELADDVLAAIPPSTRLSRVKLFAVPASDPPSAIVPGEKLPNGTVEGRIDYVARTYEVVVPEDFRGRLELQFAWTVVGTAELTNLERAPDLPCDGRRVSRDGALTTFAIRYVEADTKFPIDLEKEFAPPAGGDGSFVQARANSASDLRNGLVVYTCAKGFFAVDVTITGHATGLYSFDAIDPPRKDPVVLEIPRADAGVCGIATRADGRPLAKAVVSVYRRDGDRLIDSTGEDVATNIDGEFEIPHLAKQEHVLVVSGWPDHAPCVLRIAADVPFPYVEARCAAEPPTRLRIASKVELEAGDRTLVRIQNEDGLDLERFRGDVDLWECRTNDVAVSLGKGHYVVIVERSGCRKSRVEFDVPAADTIAIPLEPEAPPK